MSHSNVVINLVGRLRNTTNFTLEEVHVKAAARIAKAARDAGVVRLIHVSDNQASAESASRYAQTKAAGEEAVREAFPDATIVRPCDLYGPEDRFLNRYGIMVRKWPRLAGLLACGPDSRQVQPMWVSDFATALMNIVENDATAGKTFHLGGPRPYTMAQVYELVNRETISETHVRHLPDALLQRLLGYLQYSRKNLFSPEDHILHATDNVVPANAEHTAASLGMNDLATMEKKAIETLVRFRTPPLSSRGATQHENLPSPAAHLPPSLLREHGGLGGGDQQGRQRALPARRQALSAVYSAPHLTALYSHLCRPLVL